jgi:ribosomal protein S18 acetylase RimI-like enzyme
MTETTVGVRTATDGELDRVVGPIVMAFAADPVLRFFFPDPHGYLDAFPQLVRAIARPAFEHGSAQCVESFAAGALWLPPGVEPDIASIGALFERAIEPERLQTVFGVIQEKAKYHPDEPHWYLHMIGVDPRQQGRGYGSALIRHALERIDADHLAAYLESSNPANVPLYERHGFEVVATVEVDPAPPLFPMVRRAR